MLSRLNKRIGGVASFVIITTPNSMVPNNYSMLRKDELYRTIINTRMAQVKLSLMHLEFNKKSGDDLRSGIRAEIKNLEG